MVLVIILYMLLASTFTLGKAVLAYVQPIFFIGIRMSIAGALLLLYLYFFKKEKLKLKKKHFLLFAQVSFFHIFLAYATEFWALQYLTSFKTALIYNLSPFLSAILAYLFLSEKMTIKKWIGLLIGFFGFFIILADGKSPAEETKHAFGFFSWPEIALLVSVICGVYGWVIIKKLVKDEGYSPLMINGFSMLAGGILALFTSFFFESPATAIFSTSSLYADFFAVFAYTALLIIIANFLFYNLYSYLLQKYSVTFLAFVGFTCPLFAALYGTLFLGELPTIYFFLSVFVVAIGLYIFYQEELETNNSSN